MALQCGIVGLPNVGKSTLFHISSGRRFIARDSLDHVAHGPRAWQDHLANIIAKQNGGAAAPQTVGRARQAGDPGGAASANLRRATCFFNREIHPPQPDRRGVPLLGLEEDFKTTIVLETMGPAGRPVQIEPGPLFTSSAPRRAAASDLAPARPFASSATSNTTSRVLAGIVRRSARIPRGVDRRRRGPRGGAPLGRGHAPHRQCPAPARARLAWSKGEGHNRTCRSRASAPRGAQHRIARSGRAWATRSWHDQIENRRRPVGLNTVATAVGEDAGTIEEVYEKPLPASRGGLPQRTPRGRRPRSWLSTPAMGFAPAPTKGPVLTAAATLFGFTEAGKPVPPLGEG